MLVVLVVLRPADQSGLSRARNAQKRERTTAKLTAVRSQATKAPLSVGMRAVPNGVVQAACE
jgi:hypothetical protein